MATRLKIILIICACILVTALVIFVSTSNTTTDIKGVQKNTFIDMYSKNTRVQQWKHYYEVVQTRSLETRKSREFYFTAITNMLANSKIPRERAEIYAEIPDVESLWKPSAISHRGALGLWQIMPNTAKRYGYKPNDMYEPAKATQCAIKYLIFLDSLYSGDVAAVLFAYNGGETGVATHAKIFQTKNFWHIEFTNRETYNFAPKVIGAWLYNNKY
jgi:membrane-bound lytic murein transglycosylase D